MMNESARVLEDLCRRNEQRWQTLKNLHSQTQQADDEDTRSGAGQDTGDPATVGPNKDSLHVATLVELELLKSAAVGGETDRPTRRDYVQELTESYDELRHTHAVLEQKREKETQRLETLQRIRSQHEDIERTLATLRASRAESSPQNGPSSAPTTDSNSNKREYEWIQGELSYCCRQIAQLERNRKEEAPADGDNGHHNPWIAKKKTKKNVQKSAQKERPSKQLRRDDSPTTWAMDRLVLELVTLFMVSPADPYLCIDPLPISTADIEFLRRAGVVELHPENANLVRLSEYR